MTVRKLCAIAVMGAVEFVVFSSFSFILYLELITFTVVVFSIVFPRNMSVTAAFVFGMLNILLLQGVTPWSLCYLAIYPTYSLILSCFRTFLDRHLLAACLTCAFFSFLTGQLVQLPMLLFSDIGTIAYLILGLKTSLLQGAISGVCTVVLLKPVKEVLRRIQRKGDLV